MSKSHYIIPIFVPHIGCPHTCVFCNQDSITGDKGVAGSTGHVDGKFVEDTIEEYLQTIDNKKATVEVSFFGGTFTGINICKQRELLAVAKRYKDAGKINYIRMSTRPDYIDEDILTHLNSFDVDIIELGVQSLDAGVLLKSGRGHSDYDVLRASKLIKEYGITLGHQIMLGLPGDTLKRDIETVKKSIEMGPSLVRLYPALVIKDTPMEKLLREGKYEPYTLSEAVEAAKIAYSMYEMNGINVIRIGLQPTEEINEGGDIVKGPFHPSFRELVKGSIYCDIIYKYIKDNNIDLVEIAVNPKDISVLYANKKYYFNELKEKLKEVKIKVKQDNNIERNSLGIISEKGTDIISEKQYFEEVYK